MSFVPTDDGRWVDENYERLARVVQDYDPQFELRWIPPEQRTEPEERKNPYCVWDTVTNTVVFLANELTTPTEILARLFQGDNKHGNVLERIEAHNAAVKIMEMKEQMDLAEEKKDYAAFLMATNKNYITLGKGRKVDDQLRPIL